MRHCGSSYCVVFFVLDALTCSCRAPSFVPLVFFPSTFIPSRAPPSRRPQREHPQNKATASPSRRMLNEWCEQSPSGTSTPRLLSTPRMVRSTSLGHNALRDAPQPHREDPKTKPHCSGKQPESPSAGTRLRLVVDRRISLYAYSVQEFSYVSTLRRGIKLGM